MNADKHAGILFQCLFRQYKDAQSGPAGGGPATLCYIANEFQNVFL